MTSSYRGLSTHLAHQPRANVHTWDHSDYRKVQYVHVEHAWSKLEGALNRQTELVYDVKDRLFSCIYMAVWRCTGLSLSTNT